MLQCIQLAQIISNDIFVLSGVITKAHGFPRAAE